MPKNSFKNNYSPPPPNSILLLGSRQDPGKKRNFVCGTQFKGRRPQGQFLGALAINSILTSTAYLLAKELTVLFGRQERQAETFSSCKWITALDDACWAKGGKQNPTGKISLPLAFSFVFFDPRCDHYRMHPCAVNEVLTSTRAYLHLLPRNTQLTISVNPTTGLIFPRNPDTTLLSLPGWY